GVAPQDVVGAVGVVIAGRGDEPARRRHPRHRLLGAAVGALPDGVLAGPVVAPEDVVVAIAVEVAGRRDLPVRVGYAAQGLAVGAIAGVPHRVLAGGGMAPEDVGLAVAVEVAHADDFPLGVGDRRQALAAGLLGGKPDGVLATLGIAPQHVGLAVAVEVAAAREPPVGADVVRRQRCAGAAGTPDPVRAGVLVAPVEVGDAVTVEVGNRRQAPGQVGLGVEFLAAAAVGGQPGDVAAVAGVAPEHVRGAVAVDVIADSGGFRDHRGAESGDHRDGVRQGLCVVGVGDAAGLATAVVDERRGEHRQRHLAGVAVGHHRVELVAAGGGPVAARIDVGAVVVRVGERAVVALRRLRVVPGTRVVAELVGEGGLAAVVGVAVVLVLVLAVADHRVAELVPAVVGGDALQPAAEQPGDAATLVLGVEELAHQHHQVGTVGFARGAKVVEG